MKVIAGLIIGLLVLAAVACIYAIGGLIFAFLWNLLMPLLWHAAPHLSWMQGIAVSWIIGILQSIFGR